VAESEYVQKRYLCLLHRTWQRKVQRRHSPAGSCDGDASGKEKIVEIYDRKSVG